MIMMIVTSYHTYDFIVGLSPVLNTTVYFHSWAESIGETFLRHKIMES